MAKSDGQSEGGFQMNQTVTQCPLHRQQTQLSKGSDGAELSAALCKYLNVRVGEKLFGVFL